MKKFTTYLLALILSLVIIVPASAQTIREQYKTKKKDTIYGIARKYGITIDELTAVNPQLLSADYQLKKGEILNIPVATSKANTTDIDTKAAFQDIGNSIKVGVILPINDNSTEGRRMVEYYRGFLMACDLLKQEGYTISVCAWNLTQQGDPKTILLDNNAAQCDIIVGPYYPDQVAPIADFCLRNRIRLVVPFTQQVAEVERIPQIFKVGQTPALQNMMAVAAFMERFQGQHPVLIDCADPLSHKSTFTTALREKLNAQQTAYNLTSLTSSDEQFAKAFSRNQTNIVVLNSAGQEQLQAAIAKLEKLTATVQGLYISVYGYTEWLAYEATMKPYFHKYDTYIPTDYYYNPYSQQTQEVASAYRNWFKSDIQPLLPRYALMGYDHAQYFLRGLRQFGRNFIGSRQQSTLTEPIQTPLHFKRATATGGMMNDTFMLIHYRQDMNIDSVNY